MSIETIRKDWEKISKFSSKKYALNKEYMAQLATVDGAFTRAANRVDQAEAALAKLIAAYKVAANDAKALEKEVDEFIAMGEKLIPEPDGNVNLLKTDVAKALDDFQKFVAKNVASLQKDKRKLA